MCVCSLLLSAGGLRPEEALRVSSIHFRPAGVRPSFQSAVSTKHQCSAPSHAMSFTPELTHALIFVILFVLSIHHNVSYSRTTGYLLWDQQCIVLPNLRSAFMTLKCDHIMIIQIIQQLFHQKVCHHSAGFWRHWVFVLNPPPPPHPAPDVSGFRVNCAEYFPIFITVLWTAGLFFHQGTQRHLQASPSLPDRPICC